MVVSVSGAMGNGSEHSDYQSAAHRTAALGGAVGQSLDQEKEESRIGRKSR